MSIKEDAEKLARECGMQFDSRYSHWVAARGKFEGEQWYAPYYWNEVLNGNGDDLDAPEDCGVGTLFTVDGEESDVFDLPCGATILVREDSQGFVFVTVHASRDAAERKYREWVGE